MRLKLLLSAFLLFIIAHFAAAQKPVNTYSVQGWWGPPAPPFSPVVHTNGTITFRVKAPNALKVNLLFGEWDSKPQPLSRDSVGNWSITIGPVAPDIYSCLFSIGEINAPDMVNPVVKCDTGLYSSIVEVPGSPARFDEVQNVPHGSLQNLKYNSSSLKRLRGSTYFCQLSILPSPHTDFQCFIYATVAVIMKLAGARPLVVKMSF